MPYSPCPVCESKSRLTRDLPVDVIREKLEAYYNKPLPSETDIISYKVLKCEKCALEYAIPQVQGSDSFYKWITAKHNYYPESRWEWLTLIKLIGSSSKNNTRLLEVGCGSGKFLEQIKKMSGVEAIGIDTSPTSVDECASKNLETYCQTIDTFAADQIHAGKRFDYIVAFHCLEHIDNPKDFLTSLAQLLKPDGSIFLSTPYSPMSFETIWFDPLNYPPHHMTRWNKASYEELAARLRLTIEIFMPKAENAVKRTLRTLNLTWHGPASLVSDSQIFLEALMRFPAAFHELMRQNEREKINKHVAADVILVKLTAEKRYA